MFDLKLTIARLSELAGGLVNLQQFERRAEDDGQDPDSFVVRAEFAFRDTGVLSGSR